MRPIILQNKIVDMYTKNLITYVCSKHTLKTDCVYNNACI